MKKAIIAPIIAVLVLVFQAFTGVEVDEATQTTLVDTVSIVAAAGVTLWGVAVDFKKRLDKNKE